MPVDQSRQYLRIRDQLAADIAQGVLQDLLRDAANKSFNRITIDGDTSTNDCCMLIATGRAALP